MEPNQLKSQLKRFGIKPKHSLGQNFLLNESVLDAMVVAAQLNAEDTVLEIGPGLGALTRKLGEHSGLVLAVEKDHKLVKALRRLFRSKNNVKIIAGDILFLSPDDILKSDSNLRMHANVSNGKNVDSSDNKNSNNSSANSRHSSRSYKVVANIPYYITGKLLRDFLQVSDSNLRMHANVSNGKNVDSSDNKNSNNSSANSRHSSSPSLMVLLLQKEVAERIAAGPGNHSILSITTQFYAEPEIVMEVPKEDFYPAPEVDSAVVKLVVRKAPLFDADEKKFFQLVKVGFSNKRKMLVNNLKALPHSVIASVAKQSQRDRHGLRPREDIKTLLEDLEINPKARAQDLTLNDWKALYDRFFK